jgi:cation transport ATPase
MLTRKQDIGKEELNADKVEINGRTQREVNVTRKLRTNSEEKSIPQKLQLQEKTDRMKRETHQLSKRVKNEEECKRKFRTILVISIIVFMVLMFFIMFYDMFNQCALFLFNLVLSLPLLLYK